MALSIAMDVQLSNWIHKARNERFSIDFFSNDHSGSLNPFVDGKTEAMPFVALHVTLKNRPHKVVYTVVPNATIDL